MSRFFYNWFWDFFLDKLKRIVLKALTQIRKVIKNMTTRIQNWQRFYFYFTGIDMPMR